MTPDCFDSKSGWTDAEWHAAVRSSRYQMDWSRAQKDIKSEESDVVEEDETVIPMKLDKTAMEGPAKS